MTTAALDMSLDDIIENSRKSSNSRGRPRSSGGAAPSHRFSNRVGNRTTPYYKVQTPETTWQHDMFTDSPVSASVYPARASSIETGTKLYISNLDFGVSTEDIKVSPLFFLFCFFISRPAVLPSTNGMYRNQNIAAPRSSSQGRGGATGWPRGGGHGVRRGGRGRGRGRGEKISAEDLDADLEKYHSEAMQEN
ncbi:RNA AND EXPORT FACTOR BINDING PROTEIN [Salix purpurea]|uniref:RNA AND EXPORT FACTOR BINDING PROTEIN n=1 Tax=Salix purpurea TaxID=77065 RepID=A0A9Q0VW18_SALPP|nr:RNA AND EXPORT FACTOR BINDING PROTEIN [Salix purpurea]